MSGVPAWRLAAFAAYLLAVLAVLVLGLRLVLAYPGHAFVAYGAVQVAWLAWHYRLPLRALLYRSA